MKLNRKWILVMSLVLSLAIATGSTLAYLMDTTATQTNVFTLGDVEIELTEPNWQDKSVLLPNQPVAKDPTITNEGWHDAWVWMKVVIPSALYEHLTLNNVGTDWTETVTTDTNGNKVVTLKYNSTLASGSSVTAFDSVTLSANTKYADLKELGSEVKIEVTAYAIEAAQFANVGAAYAAFNGVSQFASGSGTESDPFIISEAAQLLNISNYSDYTYFEVDDDVKELDMTGVGNIVLNGSFDGNGVTMNNLSTALFKQVGDINKNQNITISNLTANVQTTDGNALVRNIFNPGTTTFANVTLHGYIEGLYNVGSFYNYGTANANDVGADYTVEFINTTSDATLVCTTGNAIGGMLGHGYQGAGNTLTINMDESSGYSGDMYTTGTATGYKVMALCSGNTFKLNDATVNRSDSSNIYSSEKLDEVKPMLKDDGYYVTAAENVDHYVVRLNAQLSAYDDNNNKIANLSGMTWSLGSEEISGNAMNGKVFDEVKTAEIVNNTTDSRAYTLDNNGKLTIYTGKNINYASGTVSLFVNQYAADNTILAVGRIDVCTIPEPSNP